MIYEIIFLNIWLSIVSSVLGGGAFFDHSLEILLSYYKKLEKLPPYGQLFSTRPWLKQWGPLRRKEEGEDVEYSMY